MPLWFSLTIQASIILVVFAIGLETTWTEATFLFRQPALLVKSLIARNIAMPLVAILLAKTFPMHPAVKGAIVLLSVTPIPPVLPRALAKAGGRASYVAGLLVSHSVLAIAFVPLTVEVLNLVFGTQAHFGPLAVAKDILLAILLPLGAGIALRHFLRGTPVRAARLIGMVGSILLLVAILPLLVLAWQALQIVAGRGALIAVVLFAVAGLAIGHALGGPIQGDRTALALATASRHPGLAIAIASANFPDQAKYVAGTVIIYLILRSLAFIPYNLWRRKVSDGGSADAAGVTARI